MIEVDMKGLRAKIDNLATKDLYKMERSSLRKSGHLLVKATKQNLSQRVPKANTHNPAYTDTLMDAVKFNIHQDNTNNFYFVVHIMGSRKKSSGTYRTKFFEGGTAPRKTKYPYRDRLGRTYPAGINRGRLTAVNFFKDAISVTESGVMSSIQTNFLAELNKYWNE